MKKAALALVVAAASGGVMAESVSDGAVELSLNVIRSDGISVGGNIIGIVGGYSPLTSSPIRLAYRFNDQISIIGGVSLFSYGRDIDGTESELKGNVITGGASYTMDTGLFIEGLWSRVSFTVDDGTNSADFTGNQFEGFVGRRFEALNGLFVEPKAGVTFGSVEMDDNDVDRSLSDGLGTEVALTLGYIL